MSANATEEVKLTVVEETTIIQTTTVVETTTIVETTEVHEEVQHTTSASHDHEEAITFFKGIDEFYPKGHIEKPLEDSKISRRNVSFFDVMGQHSYKRYNVNFLEDDIIIFITGNKYQTYNLSSKSLQTYSSMDTDGIGSIAVHNTRKYFAVAEKGISPNIYIYEWPTLKLYRILRKGADFIYAHCEFSPSGTKLVSLGGAPDFTLTVWDWVNERVILKCKAFGQEVFKSSFSPFSDDILFTGGSGHIKFWKMAKTFTGLKLQGEIAKYGQLELSDVRGFHELPDGKVLSGTEYGTMILWEGNLVKAHLVLDREKKTPLHTGGIEVILFEDDFFITAGTDGFIKWWPLKDIDDAEADEIAEIAIAPAKEVSIQTEDGEYAHIISMIKGNGIWLVSDAKGRLWKLNCHDFTAILVLEYHSGAITDLAVSDAFNMAVTCSEDGMVKVWDYCRKKVFYQKQFTGRALVLDILRRSELNKGRVVAVGFSNGIVRMLQLTDTSIELSMAFKAHDAAVKFVRFAPSQTMLVTASATGELFFFDINGHLDLSKCVPIALIQLPDSTEINDLKWSADSNKVLVCCKNGYVYEIEKPNLANVNTKDSYLIADYPMRAFKIKMMEFQMKKNQKKDEEEEEKKRRMRLRGELKDEALEVEEDWDPEPLTRVCYMNDESGNFLVGASGLYKGYYYLCSFNQERPLKALPMFPDIALTYMAFSASNDLLIQGWANGEIRICMFQNPDRYLLIKNHDAVVGSISAVKLNFDERFLLSAGQDGILFSYVIDKYMIMQEAAFSPLAGVEGQDYMPAEQILEITNKKIAAFQKENEPNIPEIDPTIDGLDESLFAVSLRGIPENARDITDASQYSIQQAKLRTEEDHRLKMAELKKEGVRHKINELRKEFKKLTDVNQKEDPAIRVVDEDFNIDPEYFIMLQDHNLEKTNETSKEVAWEKERQRLRLKKLTQKFYDVLDFEKFTVKAMRTPAYVTTFRVPKMSEFLNRNFEQFKNLMEKEITSKENMDFDDEEGHEENAQDATIQTQTKKVAAVASNQHKSEAEKKREERKIEREKRKKKIEKYLKKEHSQQSDSTAHQEEIRQAKASFGTFNLKMSHDYEVPESLQINQTKKRQQMVLLEGSIHKLKIDFNTKINELKGKKKQIISQVAVLHERLGQINSELGTPEDLVLPVIDDKLENPNKFFDVTDQEIDAFRELKKQRDLDAAANKKGGKKKGKADEQQLKVQDDDNDGEEKKQEKKDERNTHENPYFNVVAERKNRKAYETELDDEYKQIQKIELTYEKDQVKGEIDTLINDFDNEIKEMQKEKYRLESDLKNADIKLILLFEELILLKSVEDRDQELSAQLKECRDSKVEIMRSVGEIKKKLAQKQIEINVIKTHQLELDAKFEEHCHPSSNKYALLKAFYERIVKKKRKPEKIEKGDAENDDEEEGEAEEEDEVEEEDDEDEDAGIAGLPQEEYKTDEIEKLRDERLELVSEKDKISDFINMLENDRSKADKNEKIINMTLTETEESIADFQKEKMAKLNQLAVQVVLKIKQIQNLHMDGDKVNYWCQVKQQQYEEGLADIAEKYEDQEEREQMSEKLKQKMLNEEDWRGWFLPEGLDKAVLFTRDQLKALLSRKQELDIERAKLKQMKNEKDVIKKRDEKTIKEKNKLREIAKREYEERQLLRFGSLIELDTLEVSGPSAVVQELLNKFKKTEDQCRKKIEDAEAEHEKTQRELTEQVQKNTNYLDMIRNLGEEQLRLNQQLEDTNKQIFQQSDNPKQRQLEALRQEYEERIRHNKIQILEKQQEINLYKKKGGHIYTKVTTNRKMAHLQDQ